MTRKLCISLLPNGTITAEASGTPGPACLSAIEQLRQLLDAEVSDSKPTPEFAVSTEHIELQGVEDVRQEDHA